MSYIFLEAKKNNCLPLSLTHLSIKHKRREIKNHIQDILQTITTTIQPTIITKYYNTITTTTKQFTNQ